MGRPRIGERSCTFLTSEAHEFLQQVADACGFKTKAEAQRLIIEHSMNVQNIIDVLKVEEGIITEEEFIELNASTEA